MPQISITVPIYKAEKYLHKCLDCLLAQTFTNFELILVDDGSPDSSGAVCDEYAARDKRIKVIHKPNGGVSSARNAGLEIATGEWIAFVDSDDSVTPDYLEKLLRHADGADIVVGGKVDNYGNIETFPCKTVSPKGDNIAHEISQYAFCTPWGKLLKRSIIEEHQLRFDQGIKIAEDVLFILQYVKHCHNISFIEEANYLYLLSTAPSKFAINGEQYVHLHNALVKAYNELVDTHGLNAQKRKNRVQFMCFYYFQEQLKHKFSISGFKAFKVAMIATNSTRYPLEGKEYTYNIQRSIAKGNFKTAFFKLRFVYPLMLVKYKASTAIYSWLKK